jgi:competence protein ComEC
LNGIFAPARPLGTLLALAVAAGALAAQQFHALPPPPAIWIAAAASAMLWLARLKLPAAFVFGLAWALGLAAWRWHEALPADLERRDLLVEGAVLDVPEAVERGIRFGFRPEAVLSPPGAALPSRIRLSWPQSPPPVKAGQRWRLHVRLKRPHGFFNPGGMDYELWLFSQGIRAAGYVRESADNRLLAEAPALSLAAWRQALFDRLTQALAGRDMAGVVAALAMGEESAITGGQWEVFRRTGTAHLVAISGSHISLVAGLVYWLAHRACAGLGLMRLPPSSVAAVLACLAAWLYAALSGFAVPAQRALAMICVASLGLAAQRNVRPAPTLSLALLAVVLYDPLAVLSAGFWLSYGAVALILLAVAGRLGRPGWWRESWTVNWATCLGLAPLLLFFFQQVSLVSPLANLLAVPAVGVALTPLCLAGALLLGVHPPSGEAVLRLAETLLEYVWIALQWLSGLPWAQWSHPSPPAWALPFALAGAALLLAPKGIPARWLGLVLLLPAMTLAPRPPAAGQFRLTLLDVGQGLAATVQTHGHVLVFDAGPSFGKTFDTGAAVVEPFLRRQGVDALDMLVVSHGDNDHIGGAASLLKRFPVAQALSSVPARLPEAHAAECLAGQSWEWDGVRFDMLSPLDAAGGENDRSCVLRVSAAAGSALLTGDIEQAAERRLAERYGAALKADILIAPHHGSKTSSSPGFLDLVRPACVLVPSGYLNRYGFPHPDVLRRYQAAGAQVYNTASAGAVSVEPGASPPSAYRDTDGKYWNAVGADGEN